MANRHITRDALVERLSRIRDRGWITSMRPLSSGGIRYTIDQLLGLPQNNLPIAATAQWDLKSYRAGTSSPIILAYMEPEPRSARIVPQILLPYYGWPDAKRPGERSFRQTLRATVASDRGFGIELDEAESRVAVSFDASLCRRPAWGLAEDGRGQGRPGPARSSTVLESPRPRVEGVDEGAELLSCRGRDEEVGWRGVFRHFEGSDTPGLQRGRFLEGDPGGGRADRLRRSHGPQPWDEGPAETEPGALALPAYGDGAGGGEGVGRGAWGAARAPLVGYVTLTPAPSHQGRGGWLCPFSPRGRRLG